MNSKIAIPIVLFAIILCIAAADAPSPARYTLTAAHVQFVNPDTSRLMEMDILVRLDTATGQSSILTWAVAPGNEPGWIPVKELTLKPSKTP